MAPKCFQTTTNSAFPRWTAATPWQKAGVMGRKGKKKSPLTSNAHQASRDQQRMLRICYDSRTCCFSIIQRKFSSKKLLSYGWMSRGSLVVTSSSCQQHFEQEQFVCGSCREEQQFRNAWLHGWKHSRARNPVFFRVKWLVGSPESGLCFRGGFGPRCGKVVDKKSAEDCSRAWFALQNVKAWTAVEHFWKIRSAKCARDCSESSICCKIRKSWHVQSSATSSPLSALREHWSIWCDAPAMWVCSRLWQNALARLRAAKHQWCCRAPGSWQAGLQLELAKRIVIAARREELDCRSYKRGNWEAAQSRSGPHKWLFSWEKRCLSKEVAQWRSSSTKKSIACPSSHSIIHPSIHPSLHSLVHGFMDSPNHWFIVSLVHLSVVDSSTH